MKLRRPITQGRRSFFMLFRRAALFLALMGVLLAGFGIYVSWTGQRRLVSDPATPRPSDDYTRFLEVTPLKVELKTNVFASIEIQNTPSELTIKIPTSASEMDMSFAPTELLRAAGRPTIALGSGSVSLVGIGIGLAQPKTNFEYEVRVPGTFYTPDLAPIPTGNLDSILSDGGQEIGFRGVFPSVRFVFARSNLTEFKMLNYDAFDARTRQRVHNGGYASSSHENVFWYESEVALWHQTPLEIGITIATAPVQVVSLPPREGAEVRFPGGLLRLVAIIEGAPLSFQSNDDGKTNTIRLKRSTLSEREVQTSFVFVASPAASYLPLDLEFLNEHGQPLEGAGSSSSSQIMLPRLRAPAEKVKEIRVKIYGTTSRLVFQLPELPGLPVENRNVRNLFDVHIPYARFNSDWEFGRGIGQLIQMSMPSLALNPTNLYFPLTFTNTTTRALFEKLSTSLANPEEGLKPNSAKNAVEITRPPLVMLLEKIKKLLRFK